ncbi:MAG TPA: hypothetical protein VMZ69_07945 [Saprospiraceae bacterium]|nr:hypothetical protein [Saprospiraceae bacterium]
MDQKNAAPKYLPGSCNIGEKEIQRRYCIGFIGLSLTIITIILIYFLKADRYWRLIIFIPVFYSLSGFIQAVTKFCFVFGFRSVFSLEGRRKLTRVEDNDSKRKDMKKAFQIVGVVTLLSIIITTVYFSLKLISL